jgi:hypothetical protein
MTPPPKNRLFDWIPVIGTIITMLGFVWMAATYVGQLQENTRRISAIEAIQSEARLARIEAKVDILLDQKADRK